ncbi:MAG: type III-B CRISPR module RAMP protein Cmr6 [Nitrospirota bacterium]
MKLHLPLPADTRLVLKDENSILKTSNLGLLFNKYIYSWPDDWKIKEEKKEFLKDIINKNIHYVAKGKEYVSAMYNRQKIISNELLNAGWKVESFEMVTDSRLIIGLGGTSVIETGITLHPLYGFPYLPASGLKGVARGYTEIIETTPKEDLQTIFGSEDKDPVHVKDNRQGKVFFMDGLPKTFPLLDLDIMNPHYGEYYQGNKPPADYLNPKPVTFLAVAKGQHFSICLFSRDDELVTKARGWLIGGLIELGSGGKTNVGYGYFKKAVTDGQETLRKEPDRLVWNDAILSYNPGNQTLTALKNEKKAILKIGGNRAFVPEQFHKKLFDKHKQIKSNVTVEPLGNSFRIVSIKK